MSRIYKLPDQKLYYETPTGYAYIPNVKELNTLVKNKVIEPDTEQIKVRELPTRNASNTGKDSDFSTKMPTSEALKNSLTSYQNIEAGQYGLEDTLKTAIKERTAGQTIEETNKLAKSLQGIEDPLLRSGLMRQAKQAKTGRVEDLIAKASELYQQKITEAKNEYDAITQQYGLEQDIVSQAFSSAILAGGVAPEGLPEEYTESWQAASTEARRPPARSGGGGGSGKPSASDKKAAYNQLVEQVLGGIRKPQDALNLLSAELPDYISNFRKDYGGTISIPDPTNETGFQYFNEFKPITREDYVSYTGLKEQEDQFEWQKIYPEFNQ